MVYLRQNYIRIHSEERDSNVCVCVFRTLLIPDIILLLTVRPQAGQLKALSHKTVTGNEVILLPTDLNLTSFSQPLCDYGHSFSKTPIFVILFAEYFIVWSTAEDRCDAVTLSLNIRDNNRGIYLTEDLQESILFHRLKGARVQKKKEGKKKNHQTCFVILGLLK